MSANYVNEGDVLPLIAPRALNPDDIVIVGKIVGLAAAAAASGAQVQVIVEGHVDVKKTAGNTYNPGDVVHADPATFLASTAAGGTVTVGYCTRAALAGDATVRTKLVPTTV
jgi:predicted RecA/RadA family phage recombinase